MITIADLKQHLEQFDDGDPDRLRMKALAWKVIR